jgi:gas vesicle protein
MTDATSTMNAARDATRDAVKGIRTTALDLARGAADVISIARGLGLDDALRVVGLRRRRSVMGIAGPFAGGMAVGVAVGLMLAPSSGAELRALVVERFRALGDDARGAARDAAEGAREKVHAATGRVDAIADQVAEDAERALADGAAERRAERQKQRMTDRPS